MGIMARVWIARKTTLLAAKVGPIYSFTNSNLNRGSVDVTAPSPIALMERTCMMHPPALFRAGRLAPPAVAIALSTVPALRCVPLPRSRSRTLSAFSLAGRSSQYSGLS